MKCKGSGERACTPRECRVGNQAKRLMSSNVAPALRGREQKEMVVAICLAQIDSSVPPKASEVADQRPESSRKRFVSVGGKGFEERLRRVPRGFCRPAEALPFVNHSRLSVTFHLFCFPSGIGVVQAFVQASG